MNQSDCVRPTPTYAVYRPGYAPSVLDVCFGLSPISLSEARCADVGAGPGIWARKMALRGVRVDAVESDPALRTEGEKLTLGLPVIWHPGSPLATGLASQTFDLVSMDFSYHWPDFDKTVAELDRIALPGGLVTVLWNARHYEDNPLLTDILNYLYKLVPDLQGLSSGRASLRQDLAERLRAWPGFEDELYVEGRHTEYQTPEQYLGLWESVSPVRAAAGEVAFSAFLGYIRDVTQGIERIEATYSSRAWIARKHG